MVMYSAVLSQPAFEERVGVDLEAVRPTTSAKIRSQQPDTKLAGRKKSRHVRTANVIVREKVAYGQRSSWSAQPRVYAVAGSGKTTRV